MNLREQLNDNPVYVIGGAALLVVLSLTVAMCSIFGGGGASFDDFPPTKVVYYDTTNDKIILVDPEEGKPAVSPRPGTTDVFEAAVFTCGEYKAGTLRDGMSRAELESADLYIAWLQKSIDSADGSASALEPGAVDYLVRSVDGSTWLDSTREEALTLVTAPYEKCDDASRASER